MSKHEVRSKIFPWRFAFKLQVVHQVVQTSGGEVGAFNTEGAIAIPRFIVKTFDRGKEEKSGNSRHGCKQILDLVSQ